MLVAVCYFTSSHVLSCHKLRECPGEFPGWGIVRGNFPKGYGECTGETAWGNCPLECLDVSAGLQVSVFRGYDLHHSD